MGTVVFFAPVNFHIHHIYPLINKLLDENNHKIILVTKEQIDDPRIVVRKNLKLLLPKVYKAFISTELTLPPYWVICPKIYVGHGVGPKLIYQTNKKVLDFDYVFASCTAIYQAQKNMGAAVFNVGLPVLDLIDNNVKCASLILFLNLDFTKKTLCYIPSWSNDPLHLEAVEHTITKLITLKNFNIVISPHPNLLKPSKFKNYEIFSNLPLHVKINKDYQTKDVVQLCDFVFGDISSSLFEAMAIGKIAVWDFNERIYHDNKATELVGSMKLICPSLDDLSKQNEFTEFYDKQQLFIKHYIFRIGTATDYAVELINKVINKETL